ncbi:NAD(P)-binding domain-containing protein [Halopseudomonas pachastrellae]|nr:NAD(P)-binding domain-containing protein [Halopseudomonas pachastrellae]
MTSANKTPHHSVIIIGGGQAGLSASYYLQQQGVDHAAAGKERPHQRLADPTLGCFLPGDSQLAMQLPGYPYAGDDPHGFMKKDEIIAYLDGFIEMVNAPCRTGVTVQQVKPRAQGGYLVRTSDGEFTADQVIVASGGYQVPIIRVWPSACRRRLNRSTPNSTATRICYPKATCWWWGRGNQVHK